MRAECDRRPPRAGEVADDASDQRVVTLDELAPIVAHMARTSRGMQPKVVAISGIDGSGKSHVAAGLEAQLKASGIRTAVIGVDLWHTSRAERFAPLDSARVFYEHAFRWPEFFSALVDPLVRQRSFDRELEVRRLEDDSLYSKRYEFREIEIVLIEGIFLLRREYVDRYDVRVWIDCSFETALARALARNQEQLPRLDLERDYREVYFAAQRLHFDCDHPRRAADFIVANDGDQ
jgi:uridine kinase